MILSFSRPEMVPWIKAGLIAAERGDRFVVGQRTKRQTIRRLGPRAQKLLGFAATHGDTIPYALHLWWKSRTPQRELLGVVEMRHWPRVYRLSIWCAKRFPLVVSPGFPVLDYGKFAYADGFDSVEAFRDFFVPNEGDRFEGVLFKW